MSLLAVNNLNLWLPRATARAHILRNISFSLERGESFGLVGESGSGKSQLLLALLGLSPAGAELSGSLRFEAHEWMGASQQQWRALRGAGMAMVFQDPATALNPYLSIGTQLTEGIRAQRAISAAVARQRACELLERVRIAEPGRRLRQFPHQLSGGMKQRVMIAMALMAEPRLLLCDEPTTALDVSIQAELIALLQELRGDTGTGLLVVTHDFSVVEALTDRLAVMRRGELLEQGSTAQLLRAPSHPYTAALQASALKLDSPLDQPIPVMPDELLPASAAG